MTIGTIVGIAVAVIVVLLIIIVISWWIKKMNYFRRQQVKSILPVPDRESGKINEIPKLKLKINKVL